MALASKGGVLATSPKPAAWRLAQSRETGAFAALVLSTDDLLNDAQNLSFVTSSGLPEMPTISGRTLVMREGGLTGELSHAEAAEERIMAPAALGQAVAA